MTPTNIAWTISMVLWLICFIISRKLQKNGYESEAGTFVAMEWTFLGFSFIFLGFNHGWWQNFLRKAVDY